MADRLKDKVAIVTGAGSVGPGWGNGKATAVLFAREGAKVFAVDINLSAAEETSVLYLRSTCSIPSLISASEPRPQNESVGSYPPSSNDFARVIYPGPRSP
jgi:NAD(P)-dependent dehydrogenase (short-subunit alcohol dehydrogenase family)